MILHFIHIINLCSILLSSVGIVSFKHYCKDELKSSSIYIDWTVQCCKKKKKKQVKSCCAKSKKCSNPYIQKEEKQLSCCKTSTRVKTCRSKSESSFYKKSCCSDQSKLSKIDIQTNIDLDNKLSINESFEPTPINNNISSFSFYVFYPKIENSYNYDCFHPPPLQLLHILFQAFLC